MRSIYFFLLKHSIIAFIPVLLYCKRYNIRYILLYLVAETEDLAFWQEQRGLSFLSYSYLANKSKYNKYKNITLAKTTYLIINNNEHIGFFLLQCGT